MLELRNVPVWLTAGRQFPRCATTLVTFILLYLQGWAWAYTYRQVGVASNFVIHADRVYFAQSDDSLTILDLETGEVVLRKKGLWPARTIEWTESGILVQSYRGTAMLAPSTLDVIWQAENRHGWIIPGQRLIVRDGNGLVECRQLATGSIVWSYSLPGALELTARGGHLLVFRSAVYEGRNGVPAVVLLDLATGKEALHKTTPPGVHYIETFFDGERIYLAAGTYTGEHTPNITRYDKGRPSARFEQLLIWDLNGSEIESIPTPESLRNDRLQLYHEPFTLEGKTFVRGAVYDSNEGIPHETMGFGELVPNKIPIEDPKTVFTRFAVEGGALTMRPASILREMHYPDKLPVTISLESEHHRWTGRLPYLPSPGTLFAVGSTADRILLGSNLGHVECIETATGRSLWMYVFPTIRRALSASTWGPPPDRATAAAQYERDNRDLKPSSGMVLDGSTEPSQPKIVIDPVPTNPFK